MITVQRVTAVLRRSGFKASQWLRSSRVRGWGHSTEGYSAKVLDDGSIVVVHFASDQWRAANDKAHESYHTAWAERYTEALNARGVKAFVENSKVKVPLQ